VPAVDAATDQVGVQQLQQERRGGHQHRGRYLPRTAAATSTTRAARPARPTPVTPAAASAARIFAVPSILTDFRNRLVEHGMVEQALDVLLAALVARGLLKPGGKTRTGSTHVLAAVRELNRLELAGESVRAALEALARHWPPLASLPTVRRCHRRSSSDPLTRCEVDASTTVPGQPLLPGLHVRSTHATCPNAGRVPGPLPVPPPPAR
jgi:hypothetical protein